MLTDKESNAKIWSKKYLWIKFQKKLNIRYLEKHVFNFIYPYAVCVYY